MFDQAKFKFDGSDEQALERKRIKKLLFSQAQSSFSDNREVKMLYYKCVNNVLNNPVIENKEADKELIKCKLRFDSILNHMEETNKHVKIKIDRCIESKRNWSRKFDFSLAYEMNGIWECYNRFHRRYLYYYPRILKNKFNL